MKYVLIMILLLLVACETTTEPIVKSIDRSTPPFALSILDTTIFVFDGVQAPNKEAYKQFVVNITPIVADLPDSVTIHAILYSTLYNNGEFGNNVESLSFVAYDDWEYGNLYQYEIISSIFRGLDVETMVCMFYLTWYD